MFESLMLWFDSLGKESRLFQHPEDEALHSALASVLYHIISMDKQVASKEKHMFTTILKREFGLDDDQISHLYQAASSSTSDWHSDLHAINGFLKQNPAVRMNFMQYLIRLIDIDGVQDGELEAFYEALQEVFPEIRRP